MTIITAHGSRVDEVLAVIDQPTGTSLPQTTTETPISPPPNQVSDLVVKFRHTHVSNTQECGNTTMQAAVLNVYSKK